MRNRLMRIRRNFKKIIEELVRRKLPGLFIIMFFRQKNVKTNLSSLNHIVFLRPGKLGDMLVATPLFKTLKSEIPSVKITVVCSSYNYTIIKNDPHVDFAKITNFHSFLNMIHLFRWIVKSRADVVIDLTPGFSRTSTLLACFLRRANIRTAGMHKGEFSGFFDITTDVHGKHIIERNRILVETVINHKFKDSDFRPLVYSTEKQKTMANEFIMNTGDKKFRLGINLSAGHPERQWSFKNYEMLVGKLYEEYREEISVILFSHGEQREWASKIAGKSASLISPAADIITTAEILKFCRLLFTPDTVFLHFASAMKIPVIGLFHTAGENLIRWRAYDVSSKELIAGDLEEINDISPEKAFNEIKEFKKNLEREME